jgi:hypothetical protein
MRAMREQLKRHSCERRRSRARRAEEEGADTFFVCERRRSRRIHARDARAAEKRERARLISEPQVRIGRKSQPSDKRSLRCPGPSNAVSGRSYSPTMANCFVVITA